MLLQWLALALVGVPGCAMLQEADAKSTPPRHVTVRAITDDKDGKTEKVFVTTTVTTDDDEDVQVLADPREKKVIIRSAPGARSWTIARGQPQFFAAEDLPSVWIGVRLMPVPAPLAAHIGKEGVMIDNVVKESPAAEAGLERYDVVIRVDKKEIKSNEDLLTAIRAAEPGKDMQLTLVRKGKEQTVTIKPIKRPDTLKWEMKYEEPEEAEAFMRGKASIFMPQGGGDMKVFELGELAGIPDVLTHLDEEAFPHGNFDVLLGDGPEDGKVELRIKVKKDEGTTEIVRDFEGKIEVTRTDAEGKQTTATYENAEALREADPEAHKLLRRHRVVGANVMRVRPLGPDAAKMQFEIQRKVEQELARAHGAAGRARAEAEALADAARDQAQQKRVEIRRKRIAEGGEGVTTSTKVVIVRVEDDGTILITTQRDGEKKVEEFRSKGELREQNPELYEEIENLLP